MSTHNLFKLLLPVFKKKKRKFYTDFLICVLYPRSDNVQASRVCGDYRQWSDIDFSGCTLNSMHQPFLLLWLVVNSSIPVLPQEIREEVRKYNNGFVMYVYCCWYRCSIIFVIYCLDIVCSVCLRQYSSEQRQCVCHPRLCLCGCGRRYTNVCIVLDLSEFTY